MHLHTHLCDRDDLYSALKLPSLLTSFSLSFYSPLFSFSSPLTFEAPALPAPPWLPALPVLALPIAPGPSLLHNPSSNNNNNLLHLYSAFLDTQSALHSKGAISSSTTNVQHPPGWCEGSHSAPERPLHTSLLVERRQWWSQSVYGDD